MLNIGTETGSSALFLTESVWKVSKTCGAEYQWCGFSKMRRGEKKPKRSSVIKRRRGRKEGQAVIDK